MEDLIERTERILEVVEQEAERVAEQAGDERRTTLMKDDGRLPTG